MIPARKTVVKELEKFADPVKGKFLQRFFKTGKGEYAHGDLFLGITVPVQRTIAKKFIDLPLEEVFKLLKSGYHEHRLTALLILVYKQAQADQELKVEIAKRYLRHLKYINNWDLVDSSASYILGPFYFSKSERDLLRMAKSKNLWERRIAVLTSYYFIKQNQFGTTLKLAEFLLSDKHDLMHKAVGWMLREIGKKSEPTLIKFLDKHYTKMPRTMLRYAIERLSAAKKYLYMKKTN